MTISRLQKVTIGGVTTVVDLLKRAGLIVKSGNFQSYAASPFSAYTGMSGVYHASDLTFTVDMVIDPAHFPSKTVFDWSVTPSSSWSGVNGFLHVDYGNYDYSPGTITPKQVNSLTNLTVNAAWTYTGDPASGMLSELWLASASTPSGSFTKLFEVGFFPKLSAGARSFVASLPVVGTGSYVDDNGVTWNVVQATGATPYLVAYRPGFVDFEGPFLFHNYLAFLKTAGVIAGTEWINGVSFGVEPFSGAGSLSIDSLAVTYA